MQAVKTTPSLKGSTPDSARAPTLRLDLRSRQQGRPQTVEEPFATHSSPDKAPSRDALERELDRVQSAVQASEASFGQQLNWLLLAQALFLNAYLVVLVFGSGAAVPGRRWLLAGLAIFAVIFAAFTYLALRGSRDTVSSLRAARRDLEATLARQGRAPLFAPKSIMGAGLSSFAVGVLPVAFIVGWLVISVYALATPNGPMPRNSEAAAVTYHSESAAQAQPDLRSEAGAARNGAARSAASPTATGARSARDSTESATPSGRTEEPKRRTGFKW